MDAPKCRLCGKKHWGACQFDEPVLPEKPAPESGREARERRRERHQDKRAAQREAERRYRERNREAYNARQRELMRNRRKRQGDG